MGAKEVIFTDFEDGSMDLIRKNILLNQLTIDNNNQDDNINSNNNNNKDENRTRISVVKLDWNHVPSYPPKNSNHNNNINNSDGSNNTSNNDDNIRSEVREILDKEIDLILGSDILFSSAASRLVANVLNTLLSKVRTSFFFFSIG